MVDADAAARRMNGGELSPRRRSSRCARSGAITSTLAMARPDRLCRLASRIRCLALGDGPAQTLAAAAAKSGGGTSGAEIKMSTPVQAAKRRTALGAGGPQRAGHKLRPATLVATETVKSVAKSIADVSPRPPCVKNSSPRARR